MTQHIGIVAGSAEGAALCYRTICVEGMELLGGYAHPEVSMHTPSLADYAHCLFQDDWKGVAELMLASAGKLAKIGADFLICPDNSLHRALPHVEPRSPVPWLHIAAVVAEHAAGRGFRRVGLTGMRVLVESDVYADKLTTRGLEYVRPDDGEREEINRIIVDELVYGVFKPEAVAYFQRVFTRLKDTGCDAVVLGCTEIPLIMNDSNSPLPTLDSTRLLARAALHRAVHSSTVKTRAEPSLVRVAGRGRRNVSSARPHRPWVRTESPTPSRQGVCREADRRRPQGGGERVIGDNPPPCSR